MGGKPSGAPTWPGSNQVPSWRAPSVLPFAPVSLHEQETDFTSGATGGVMKDRKWREGTALRKAGLSQLKFLQE